MKLDEKRKVIEVLLCASDPSSSAIPGTAYSIGVDQGIAEAASNLWWAVQPSPHEAMDLGYEIDACEAAYRLIESSATLRKEWFGQ